MNRRLISNQNSKSCRICLDDDNQNDLIRPCLCSGGSAYVHRKCLDNWRASNNAGRGFKFCEVCKFEYVIEPVIEDQVAEKKRLLTFRLLVTRDITLIILLIQALLIALTVLVQAADKKNHAIKDLFPPSDNTFGIYYLSSLIFFLALLGFFGLIGACCGWIASSNDPDEFGCSSCQCFWIGAGCGNCNGNDCNCNNGGGDGQGMVILLIVIVVAFAVIGVFVGIILSVMIIQQITRRHTKKLWLRQEAKKYVVKDFEGHIDELKEIANRNRTRNSSRQDQINTTATTTNATPSAPIEITNNEAKYTVV